MSVSVTFEGADAVRVLRLLAEDNARAPEPTPGREDLERRILEALPARDTADACRRAGIPGPYYAAGHVVARMRQRGLVAWTSAGLERVGGSK